MMMKPTIYKLILFIFLLFQVNVGTSLGEYKYEYSKPTQSPIDPPYRIACQLKKNAELIEPESD